DAAVLGGMPRAQAYKFAAQAVMGSAITSASPKQRKIFSTSAVSSGVTSAFGVTEVMAQRAGKLVGVSGSSPAYVFMFIEAMADAAVLGGMPRAQAYKFAAQAVMGSAKMVLETGEHPGALKDMVCSPGGTTIEAVRVLEEKGFRAAVIEAMTKCMEKSEKLSKS
ncbi:pyrroline-5-carboxylate reductase dimerization domain-containing protein, partial [Escherichia sp. HC-CC]